MQGIPESNKCLTVESGIREIVACGIRNTAQVTVPGVSAKVNPSQFSSRSFLTVLEGSLEVSLLPNKSIATSPEGNVNPSQGFSLDHFIITY